MAHTLNVAWWVRHWSLRDPRKTAVLCGEQSVSYGQLYRRALGCARWLQALGLGKGDRLAVLLGNGLEFLELYLAAAGLGVVFVPLNFRCAPEEIEYFLINSDADAFVAGAEFLPALHRSPAVTGMGRGRLAAVARGDDAPPFVAGVSDYAAARDGVPDTPEEPAGWLQDLTPDDPQIIMYTSGTTGRPKGAVLPYRKTFFNSLNAEEFFQLSRADVMLVLLPMFHSGGLLIQASPALYKGLTIVLHRKFSAERFYADVAARGVTRFLGVPTIYRLLLEARTRGVGGDISSLGVCGIGGEKSDPDLVARCEEAGFPLCELMGQTETSIFLWASHADLLARPGTVGRPVFHAEVRVVDAAGAPLPPGAVGELEVRGPIVMSGYWRDPAKTAAAFRGSWLRTGDLARCDGEGFFFLLDRCTDLFISGGENVYPAEVERVLKAHPAVAEAAVIGTADPIWGQVGHAFVIPAGPRAPSETELAAFCTQHLAAYKVPRRFTCCAEFPRTAIGKVKKTDLPGTKNNS
jgi:fatty-acyl-CoA synthase